MIMIVALKLPNKEDLTMPKMKTRRAAAKRFKKTGTGEFKRAKAFKSHILNINLLPARETCVSCTCSQN